MTMLPTPGQFPWADDLNEDMQRALDAAAQIETLDIPGQAAAAVAAQRDAMIWTRASLPVNTDLNTVQAPGVYPILSGTHPNQPQAAIGSLEVLPMGVWLVQRFTVAEAPVKVYQRRKVISGGADAWGLWEPSSLRFGEMSSSSDFDTFTTEGMVGVNSTNRPNQPVATAGHLQVMRLGTTGVLQRFTTWEATPRVFLRRGSTNGSFPWLPWSEQPSKAQLDAAIASLQSAATPSTSGTKIAPLAVTLPGGTITRTASTGAARWVRRYAHKPSRVRLHVSNRNPANLTSAEAVTLVGARIGVGNPTTGVISSQVDAMPANSPLPVSTTAELVGPWVDVPGVDGDAIGITLAWSGGGLQQMLYGGGWTMEGSTSGWSSQALASGYVRSQGMTPFYVWLEAEVPARVPLVGGVGDSITVGTSTTDPVTESWLALYALAEGALPVFYAQHGSTSASWTVGNQRWTSLYPGLSPQLDAMVRAIGRNDITAGVTADQLQTKDAETAAAVAAVWPRVPQYLATITPYAGEDAAAGVVRRAHNVRRATLPNGERGVFDFAAAVGTPEDTALATAYSADGLHPNAAGQAAMAAKIIERPVTPYTVSSAKLRTIGA